MSRPGAGFEEWQAELHGHDVVYRLAGGGSSKPVVVLIHGMVNSSRHWQAVAEGLAQDHTVIAPDLIGHGDSATPRGDYSIGAHAAAIRDLLSALGVRRATIVGHSLGGGVAMQFFWQFPDQVERLVLISSGGLGPNVSPLLRVAALPGASPALALAARPRVLRGDRGAREGARAARLGQGGLPRRRRAGAAAAPGRGVAARLPPDPARGDRRPRSARERRRPPLPARADAEA